MTGADQHIVPPTGSEAPAPDSFDTHDGFAERALPVATFILAILLVLGDCSGSAAASDQETTPVPMTEIHVPPASPAGIDPLELRLETPARASAGVPVPLRLVLANPTSRPITIDLGGTPTAFDFIIHTVGGVEIWRRLEGMTVRDVLEPRTIEPGSSIRFTASWPQRDDDGRPVGPGLYRVTGILPHGRVPGGRITDGRALRIGPDVDAPRPPYPMPRGGNADPHRPDSSRKRTFLLHSAGSFLFQRYDATKITLDIPPTGRYCR